ncbi:lipopolysaccharide biosynthesis protein [Mucilaginibacter limnophilus]|uniref:Lipopolysaccharide biosynthesis protein n=1 Tax=Mucilaginibacter limnophilus TaxID=1932778 RepID=A0A437MTG1_9SPHI|nr:lipopolysaccharide biosynthesis protein [Mucilaginibacter limnophilus]RVU00932.1 lipopolysaccharide biosynthesis protein [Mucilaginibacter limnophilus]
MIQTDQENKSSSNEVTLEDMVAKAKSYYNFLKRNRLKILLVGILCAAIGIGVAFIKKPKYIARITFGLHDEPTMGGGLSSLASQLNLLGGSNKGVYSGFNLLPFLTSRLMIQKTLLTEAEFQNGKKELLINYYLKKNKYYEKWDDEPLLHNLRYTATGKNSRLQDSVIGELYKTFKTKNLMIDRLDKKSTIIYMQFIDTDELFAKNFIEALAANATDFYIRSKTKKSADNLRRLQNQADSMRRVLDNALAGAASSTDAVPNANPLRQTLRVSAQKRMVDVEANKAALIEVNKSLQLAKITLNQDTPLIDFLDMPILPLEEVKLGKITGGILGFIAGIMLSVAYLTARKIFSMI